MQRHFSHKPYTTAVCIKLFSLRKKEFKGWLWIFKQHFCNLKRGWIFRLVPAKWIDVNYFVFFNIDDIDLEMNSVAKRYANYIFLWRRLKVIFQTYRMTTPSTGNKHDIFVTVSEFSLDSKWSTVNVSISSFLKLQLSRLFVTRSVMVLCLKWKKV